MEKIEPKYITFEQAKLLKEKGFGNIECSGYYHVNEGYEKGYSFCHSKMIEQYNNGILAPEQWQVCEWLRVNHNIDLQAICNYSEKGRSYRMGIIYIKENKVESVFLRKDYGFTDFIEFYSPQEAYSAAFDYILNELI
jgi:hypothetical protein